MRFSFFPVLCMAHVALLVGCSDAKPTSSNSGGTGLEPVSSSIDQSTPDAVVRSFLTELRKTQPDKAIIRRMLSDNRLREFGDQPHQFEFWLEQMRREGAQLRLESIDVHSVRYGDSKPKEPPNADPSSVANETILNHPDEDPEKASFARVVIRLSEGDREGTISVVKHRDLWYWDER